ncbi:hypothetical protein [Streptomyces phaeofaciens]|uniref:hypothetical protein n=1 Tax=Streptomyces phaeofaciens TaxID=68254 RepID=UPI001672CA1C|nr:hypothetical protein [Streptomyces phaeofaciens]
MALLHAEATGLNIDLTPDLLGRAMAPLDEGLLARLLDPRTSATTVAEVWNAAYNNTALAPDSAVVVCLAVRHALRPGAAVLQRHLGTLRWKATWCHVHLFLAGSLYQHAKELMGRGRGDLVRPMLMEALRCWDVVEPNDGHLAGGRPGCIWRGMRGVTRLVLARQDPDPFPLLRGARVDLRLAEERGDTSPEHFAFLLEVLYRLAPDPAETGGTWDEADRLVERARAHVDDNFAWLCALGELHLRKAQSVTHGEDGPPPGESAALAPGTEPATEPEPADPDPVLARRTAALGAYEHALDHFRHAREQATGQEHPARLVMLRHNHGVARAGIARSLQALKRTDEAREHYASALDDLRWSATHHNPVQGSAFPSALLDFGLYLYRARDFAAAHAHAEEAHGVCAATPGVLPEERHRLAGELWRAAALRGLWPWTETSSEEIPEPDDASAPDPAEVRTRLDALLAAEPADLLSAVPLVQSARLLIALGEAAEDLTRIRAALATLHDLRETAHRDNRSWLSTRLGMLYGQLDRLCRSADVPEAAPENLLARAYACFGDAVVEATERRRSIEFGLGRAALHHAKALLADEGASEAAALLLHEARDVLLVCLDEPAATDPVAAGTDVPPASGETAPAPGERPLVRGRVASHLGETCLRLHALTRDDTHLREAVGWFETALADGDAAGNVQGMLGDAYLRLARAGGEHDLRTALALKAGAREAGDRSRENLSVSAAGHHRLWRSTRAPEEFTTAVGLALQACVLSPDWPWPLLQLADMAGAPAAVRSTAKPPWETDGATVSEVTAADAEHLHEAVRAGDQGRLHERAARTAVHSRAFRQAVLGGRSKTFVLDDPHRLLSTTLVLKPTYRSEAETEQDRLGSLRRYLRDTGAPHWMRLPEVLALVDLPAGWSSERQPPPDTALASRRAVGRSLAGVIADAYEGRGRSPFDRVTYALRYLARIHVWSSGITDPGPGGPAVLAPVVAELAKRAGRLHVPDATGLAQQWAAATPRCTQALPGRDAHAENWLITDTGDVVALDLEPHGRLPLLYEVAQLIEDHAALNLKDSDWPDREALCRVYLDELTALGHPATVAPADVLPAYQAFALVRAVFLTEHLTAGPTDATSNPASTGSRRWSGRRLTHAQTLLRHCADTATEKELRDIAARLDGLLPG